MRAIGHLPEEAAAHAVSDYLLVEGVPNQAEQEDDGRWTLWIHEDDHLARAQEVLGAFLQNPKDPKYGQAGQKARGLREKEEREEAAWRKRFFQRGSLWRGATVRVGGVTAALVAVCVTVALIKFVRGPDEPLIRNLYITSFTTEGGWISYTRGLPEVRSGQIWRLITPILLHGDLLHLLFNMFWLMDLGSQIEARSGGRKLSLMVVIIAALSNLGQYYAAGPAFLGMSGVVFGLFGYVWVRSKLDPRSGLFLSQFNVVLMVIWLFLCTTGLAGAIANVAHFSGIGLGLLWGFLAAKLNPGG
jgi:GlpG protein